MSASLSNDELLEAAARDGSIDIAEWPRVLENVLQRLHDIVHKDFPLPVLPPPLRAPVAIDPDVMTTRASAAAASATESQTPGSSAPALPDPTPAPESAPASQTDDATSTQEPLSQTSESTDKENDAPSASASTPSRPPVPPFPAANHAATLTTDPPAAPFPALPPDLVNSYNSSTKILQSTFATHPPYTVQRLAELVLYPKRYYRFLPPYLLALDRVVSVTSPTTDFPLPQLSVAATGGFLANGDPANGINDRDAPGSDASLGGALLTPIPWARKDSNPRGMAGQQQELRSEGSETIQGPNGAGVIETVSVTTNGISMNHHAATSSSTTTPVDDPQNPSPTTHLDPPPQPDPSEDPLTLEQELRSSGAVTQGELLRQEQEHGVIREGQDSIMPRRALAGRGAVATGRDTASLLDSDVMAEETPHARGPGVIGAEDTGPQDGLVGAGRPLDMEAAVGRVWSPPAEVEQTGIESVVADDATGGEQSVEKDTEAQAVAEAEAGIETDAQAEVEVTQKPEEGEVQEKADEDMPDAS